MSEIFSTSAKPEPLRWKDIRFHEDFMTVHLQENIKKKDNNRRKVNIVVGKPLMEKFYEEVNPDREDAVFRKTNPSLYCPECGDRVEKASKQRDRQMTTKLKTRRILFVPLF